MDFDSINLNQHGVDEVTQVKNAFKMFSETITQNLPESRERSIAQTKLEECSFWVIRAVAERPENQEQK